MFPEWYLKARWIWRIIYEADVKYFSAVIGMAWPEIASNSPPNPSREQSLSSAPNYREEDGGRWAEDGPPRDHCRLDGHGSGAVRCCNWLKFILKREIVRKWKARGQNEALYSFRQRLNPGCAKQSGGASEGAWSDGWVWASPRWAHSSGFHSAEPIVKVLLQILFREMEPSQCDSWPQFSWSNTLTSTGAQMPPGANHWNLQTPFNVIFIGFDHQKPLKLPRLLSGQCFHMVWKSPLARWALSRFCDYY